MRPKLLLITNCQR